jgi:hypothetical protein
MAHIVPEFIGGARIAVGKQHDGRVRRPGLAIEGVHAADVRPAMEYGNGHSGS